MAPRALPLRFRRQTLLPDSDGYDDMAYKNTARKGGKTGYDKSIRQTLDSFVNLFRGLGS